MNDPNEPYKKEIRCHKCGLAKVRIKIGVIFLFCLKGALEADIEGEPWEDDDE